MKTYRLVSVIAVPAAGIWVMPLLIFGLATANAQPAYDGEGQVLTRGPIHEAFAEAPMLNPMAGPLIAMAPRSPITELPPDQRPEGNNVAWISGYWGWDDGRSDFIWVSGVWRDIPPGRQWIPGYWGTVEGGSRWVSGFWGDVAQTEVTYLPAPPEPLELGPNIPTPGPNNVWTSGSWVWQQTRYDWQPGYWVAQQPDWVWSPAHYTWTPRGCVYVPGYWDHDIIHRGVMFAPVYYDRPVYRHSNYSYSPNTVIDLAVILASLFVQSQSHHYYYGDYYDARYEQRGYHPWYSQHSSRYGYDPIYTQYRSTQLRRDPNWDLYVQEQFRYRRDHIEARPPQTLALQINFINNQIVGGEDNVIIGRSLADAIQSKRLPRRFTSVNVDERNRIADRGRKVRDLEFERARVEALPKVTEISDGGGEPVKVIRERLPVSPVAATSRDGVGAKIPPPVPVASKPQGAERKVRMVKPENAETRTKQDATEQAGPQVRPAKLESTVQTPETKPRSAKQKSDAPRVRTKSRAPQAVQAPDQKNEPARQETKSPKPSHGQNKPRAVKVKRDAAKPQTTAPRVDSTSRPSQAVQAPQQKNEPARQETKSPKPSHDQNKPRTVKAKRDAAKQKSVAPRVDSKSRAPQAVQAPQQKNEPARQEAKSPKASHDQNKPKTVEAKRDAGKPAATGPKVKSQELEPRAQQPRADTKIRGSKSEPASRNEVNEKKKKDKNKDKDRDKG